MKQLILVCSILLLVSLSACGGKTEKQTKSNSVEYETYHNQLYNYSVEYPTILIPQGESDNGDGQKFISENKKTQLLVYRDYKNNYLTGGELYTLEEAFQEDLKMKDGVFNKKIEDNYYIIAYKTDEIVYTHYAQLHKDNYYNILFQYPQDESDNMKEIIKHVTKSFEVDVYGAESGNAFAKELEDTFIVFIEDFLNDCYWGKNFNSLLHNNDETLNAYIHPEMDVRRYHAPGTVAKLASRSEGFGFDDCTDFETKPEANGEEVFELIENDESSCMLDSEANNKIYYQWIETVPDLLVDMETYETEPVEMPYTNAGIVAVYLPNAYNNPVGYYFIYTPNGWKLAFVDDTLCGA